eukprot:11195777-Lingulodinium_polyedra.AAC.1
MRIIAQAATVNSGKVPKLKNTWMIARVVCECRAAALLVNQVQARLGEPEARRSARASPGCVGTLGCVP